MAICPRCHKPMDSNTASGYCSTCEAALRFTGELPKAKQNTVPGLAASIIRQTPETKPAESVSEDKQPSGVVTARCMINLYKGSVLDLWNGPNIGTLVASTLKKLTKSIEENNNYITNICYGPVIETAAWVEETVSIIYKGSNRLKRFVIVSGKTGNTVNELKTEWLWED